MATTTSRLALRKPDPNPTTGDFIDVDLDLNGNWDKIDAVIGALPCTSSTRPGSPFQGQFIYESDTGAILMWNGTAWRYLLREGATIAPAGLGSTALFRIYSTSTASGNRYLALRGSGDSQDHFIIDLDGNMQWGSGSAGADTNLFRSSANVLRTDDTFSIGGDLVVTGIGRRITGYRTSDLSRASDTSITNDPVLLVALAANSVYKVTLSIGYNGPTSNGLKWALNRPSGATGRISGVYWNTSFLSRSVDVAAASTVAGTEGTSVNEGFVLSGIVSTSGSSGNLNFAWGQNSSSATNTTVLTGSYLDAVKVG